MKVFPLAVILLILVVSVSLAGCTHPETDTKPAEMKVVAGQLTKSINGGLIDLKAGVQNNSRALSTVGLSGQEAEAILADNLMHYPWAVSSLVISREGIVMTAVPANYAGIVGTNLSWQPQFQKANTARGPVVSGVFRMAERFNGVSQSYPVFSSSGGYLGYTDITYAPEVFLGRYIDKATNGTAYDVWVAQADGTEIYDTTKEEIGKNILSDSVYADPDLQKVINRIVREPSGTATYKFWDRDWNRNITKLAAWDTAGVDGAEWRVVVTLAEGEEGVKNPGTTVTTGVPNDARYTNLTRFVLAAAEGGPAFAPTGVDWEAVWADTINPGARNAPTPPTAPDATTARRLSPALDPSFPVVIGALAIIVWWKETERNTQLTVWI
jgi:hypothetical protein